MAGDPTSAALAQQRAAQQRVHQAQLAQQAQQRQTEQRQAQQRQTEQRQAQQRQAQQRQAQQRQAQQRQAQQRQAQHRQQQQAQRRTAELQRRQTQRLRIWQRTAAKRAARQVETELAIEEREKRQRADAAPSSDQDDSLLAAAVSRPLKIGLPALRRRYMVAPVDVGDLDVPLEPPRPEQFRPARWVPRPRAARERRETAAEAAYQAAVAAYEAAEFDRVRQLSTAKRDHQQSQAAVAERLWADYQAGDRAAVETFAQVVLTSRPLPPGFGSSWPVQYEPEPHQLAVEYELPGRVGYADVAQIVLRALFDLFHVLDEGVVEVISFNGLAIDGPSLVSATVTRERWAEAPLLGNDAQAVLRALSD